MVHCSFHSQKSTNHKHCYLFKASRHGIERLEIGDKEDDKNPKIITLENCVKITQEPPPANLIHIVTKTETLTLNALNDKDLKDWLDALQSVAFKDKTQSPARNSVMEEDNDLYCTSYTDGIFTVNLQAADLAQINCSLEPKTYTLHLTATEIQLKNLDVNGATIVAKWPYRYIRKYGYRDGKFTFEAGRKCNTGEGVFSFHHINPQEVFRCMGAKMKSMKKLINGDSIPSLDCGEHQWNAALSMEAGSRSPLPPSPNQVHADNEQSQSSHILRGFLSSTDSLNNSSFSSSIASNNNQMPVHKITPCKPPRKTLPHSDSTDKINRTDAQPIKASQKSYDYEPVSIAQTGLNDPSKPMSKTLKTSPPPPLPTSPIPNNGNSSKANLSLPLGEHHTIVKSPIHSPAVDQPPRIPARYESMLQDDRNYERIENISNAWKTRGVNDVKHTENMKSTEDDFTDFVRQRSQVQKEITGCRKVPVTVSAYCDADDLSIQKSGDDNYDRLDFFGSKSSNACSDYRTIVTITTPVYRQQSSQPITSNDYEIIGECGTVSNTMTVTTPTSADHKSYRLADDSYMGYGVLRKPTAFNSKSSSPNGTGTSGSSDDLLKHIKYNGVDYAISKPKQV